MTTLLHVQLYRDGSEAYIFDSDGQFIAILPHVNLKQHVEKRMIGLGFKRKSAWAKAKWGHEARFERGDE